MSLFADNAALQRSAREDGADLLSCRVALPSQRPDILERLRLWAEVEPGKLLLTAPVADKQREAVTYGAALRRGRELRAALAGRGLRKGDTIASLVQAGVDALILRVACLVGGYIHVALPPFPFRVSPTGAEALSLLDTVRPSLLVLPTLQAGEGIETTTALLADLLDEYAGQEIGDDAAAFANDRTAIFFTSGSTGTPKGVPITRGMISSNQAAIAAMWPFVVETPPVLIDWLPWHHVFGGLDNLFKIIWNGGTLHIDAAPSEATMARTIDLIGNVAPTMHITVPLGLKLLLDRIEADPLAEVALTRRLRVIFFAGAGIDATLWRRLQALRERHAAREHGFEVLSGYGATEAASTICLTSGPLDRPGELGIPLPGHQVALVERDGRTELCVSGPNVASCYLTPHGEIDLPVDAFGFYRTGDAALVSGRKDGAEALFFDGRLAEDFKLSSGIKVRTGPLKAGLLAACAPLASDIVVAGENCEALTALVFVAGHKVTPAELAKRIALWNRANPGSSTAIARFAVADFLPDRAKGEASDKGQIVQARFLRNHVDLFEALQSGRIGFDISSVCLSD